MNPSEGRAYGNVTRLHWLWTGLSAALCGSGLLRLSWGRWLHPVVDFGRELYVPWRIIEGDTLYSDLAWFNGPLSPWLNSLVFGTLGTSLQTLVWTNTVLLAMTTVLLIRLIGRFTDTLTTVVSVIVFLVCFAFADPTGSGTYNFVAPYSHEMTHGFLLSIVALILLLRSIESRLSSWWTLSGVGLAAGLVFLTKGELFAAIAPMIGLGLCFVWWQSGAALGTRARSTAWVVGPALLPVALAFLWLARQLPPRQAGAGLLGAWRYVFTPELHDLPFYRGGLGLLSPAASVTQMVIWLVLYGVLFLPAIWLAWRTPSHRSGHRFFAVGVGLAAGLATFLVLTRFSVLDVSRPLPILVAGLVGWVIAPSLRRSAATGHTGDRAAPPQQIPILITALFALGLMLKILLRVRLSHYGFVLAAPAMLLLVALLLHAIPRWIEGRGGSGGIFRAAALGFLIAVTTMHGLLSLRAYSVKIHPVGHGLDTFLADASGLAVQRTLSRLDQIAEPGETLAVLPEGVMLNYLSRRRNPTPFFNFMPPELLMFGEEEMVAALNQFPPDWVVMTGRGASEYGYEYLGRGYGERLAGWVRDHYQLFERVDAGPDVPAGAMSWTLILKHAPAG